MTTIETLRGIQQGVDGLSQMLSDEREKRELARAEDKAAFDERLKAIDTELEGLRAQASHVERFTMPGTEPHPTDPSQQFSLAKAFTAIATRSWDGAEFERDVMQSYRQRAMGTETDSAGGFMVPEEAIPQVIERLKAETAVFPLGARSLPCTGSPVTIPRLATSATANWISGENSTITASDLSLESVVLTPKKLAARVILSNELMEMAVPAADQFIEDDLVSELSIGMDKGALEGTGGSGQPLGIVNEANVNTATATSGQVTYAELTQFITALAEDNALRGSLGWAINPTMIGQLMKVPSENAGAGTPSIDVGRKVLSDAMSDRLMGYPYRTTTSLTGTSGVGAGSMIFGNFNDLIIAQWGGLRLRSSDSSDDAFSKDQTHIRAIMRCDVAVRHPESFCVAS